MTGIISADEHYFVVCLCLLKELGTSTVYSEDAARKQCNPLLATGLRKLCVAPYQQDSAENCNRQWTSSESFIYFHQSFCLSAHSHARALFLDWTGLRTVFVPVFRLSACLSDCLSVCQCECIRWWWCGQQTILSKLNNRRGSNTKRKEKKTKCESEHCVIEMKLIERSGLQNKRLPIAGERLKLLSYSTVCSSEFSGSSPAQKKLSVRSSLFLPFVYYLMRRFIHLQCSQIQKQKKRGFFCVRKLVRKFIEMLIYQSFSLLSSFSFFNLPSTFVSPFLPISLSPLFLCKRKKWIHK